MGFDILATLLAGIIYFCLKQLWYSSWVFGKEPPFVHLFQRKRWIFELIASFFLAISVQFFLFVFSSPSTVHGMYVAGFLWLGLLLPSYLLSMENFPKLMIDQGFQFAGMLFLGAFLGS